MSSPNSADWDVLVVQPELVLRDPGLYDAQALSNSPSLDVTFRVLFVWLGIGVPGAQPFTFYNPDFSTRVSGETSVPLTLLTSEIVTGPYVPETNAVWTVTNKTFTVPIPSSVRFFRLSGPLPTRIVSIRVVGNQIVIKYELIQSALIMEPSPASWSGGEGWLPSQDRNFEQPHDMHVRNVSQHYRKAWLA